MRILSSSAQYTMAPIIGLAIPIVRCCRHNCAIIKAQIRIQANSNLRHASVSSNKQAAELISFAGNWRFDQLAFIISLQLASNSFFQESNVSQFAPKRKIIVESSFECDIIK